MKESPGRYINPFLSDEENDKVNCITNLDDGMFEKSLEPSNVRSESIEKAKEVYIDKNVTCYEENGYNDVKDICVDEGLSHDEMIKCDKEQHELSCSPVVGDGDKHDDMIKDDIDIDIDTQLKSSTLEDCCKNSSLSSVTEDDNVPSSHASDKIELFVESNIRPDNSTQNGEEELDSSSNLLNDSIRVLSEEKLNSSSKVNNSISVLEAADKGANQQLSEQQSTGSEPNEPRPTSHTFDIPNEIKTEEITNSDSDNVKPSTTSGSHELVLNTEESPPNHLDMASNNILAAPRGGGETSFSMAGSVSGHITFLGPITSAGSISHRSDGSNTSVRSFAFPILQNEWNSSPVRMAKADPRQSRKHRGWRQALLCCRF